MKLSSLLFYGSSGLLLLLLPGCSAIFGLRQPNPSSTAATITQRHQRYGVSDTAVLLLQTGYYEAVKQRAGTDKHLSGRHMQPLQLLCFNRQGQLVSWLANCDAPAGLNIKWDRLITTLPPESPPLLNDWFFTRNSLLDFIENTHGQRIQADSTKDFTVVLFWSDYMSRQTKGLIARVQRVIAQYGREKLQYLPVCLDLCNNRLFGTAAKQ